MAFYDKFPYTNFQELNLDLILKVLKEQEEEIEKFVSINALKYANPLQWNITTQYEKNTIVVDPATEVAYISVAPVPVGVSILDTDYWTPVFDLHIMLDDFQEQIDTFESDVNNDIRQFKSDVNNEITQFESDVNDDITQLRTDVNNEITQFESDVNDDITALDNRMVTMENILDDFPTPVFPNFKDLKNGRFVIFGDSYAGGYDPDTGYSVLANGWAKQLQNRIGVSDDNNFIIFHDGGVGFCNPGGTMPWPDQITSYISQVSHPETINYVIFGGGYNDYSYSASQLKTAISLAATRARTAFPNAIIYCAFFGMNTNDISEFRLLCKTKRYYEEYSSSTGMTYLKPAAYALVRKTYMSSDGFHPVQSGNGRIADACLAGLVGNTSLPFTGSAAVAAVTNVTMPQTGSELNCVDDRVELILNPQTITLTNQPTVTFNGTYIPLFTTDCSFIREFQYTSGKVIPAVIVYDDNGTTKYIQSPVALTIVNNNQVAVIVEDTNAANNNYLTLTIKQIQFPYLSFSCRAYASMLD